MAIDNLVSGAKEQSSQLGAYSKKFKKALEDRRYSDAVKIADKMPDCIVCYYSSYHLDNLVAFKRVGEARKVVKLLGRNLKEYLLSVYGLNGRNKPYKALNTIGNGETE